MPILMLTGAQPIVKGDAPPPPEVGTFSTSDGRRWSIQAIPAVSGWRVIATEVGTQVLAALVATADNILVKAEMIAAALREGRAPPIGNMRRRGDLPLPEALRGA